MTWSRFVIDAVFRGGKKHSNHGDTVAKMVKHIVNKIRKKYRLDIPIIIKIEANYIDIPLNNIDYSLVSKHINGRRM